MAREELVGARRSSNNLHRKNYLKIVRTFWGRVLFLVFYSFLGHQIRFGVLVHSVHLLETATGKLSTLSQEHHIQSAYLQKQ